MNRLSLIMKFKPLLLVLAFLVCVACDRQQPVVTATSQRHRILVSSDIGGTDADDNQSMLHLLMYSNEFDIEGLISSPSFGDGSKDEILRMIDEYEQDAGTGSWACEHHFPTADSLRQLCKQGRHGGAPLCGYDVPTEGSDWIVRCARRDDSRPLWVLVWGALEDVAQALHDAPDIAQRLRIMWIGGPNKKWGTNAYNYLVTTFPDLWFIEDNATYRGFTGNKNDSSYYQAPFWQNCMKGHGVMGDDFVNYYKGIAKMGDTPTLLYLMGRDSLGNAFDANDPTAPHWGGQFERMTLSPKFIVRGPLTEREEVPVFSLMEWQIAGPTVNVSADSACITLHVCKQDWPGYYVGNGLYMVRYAAKAAGTLDYSITSTISGFPQQTGVFTVNSSWKVSSKKPKNPNLEPSHIHLGETWWTDISAATTACWRNAVMADWAERFDWIQNGK